MLSRNSGTPASPKEVEAQVQSAPSQATPPKAEKLGLFASPVDGKAVADVEYDTDFWELRQGQLIPKRGVAKPVSCNGEKETTWTVKRAPLLSATKATKSPARQRSFKTKSIVSDLEYHPDYYEVIVGTLTSKDTTVIDYSYETRPISVEGYTSYEQPPIVKLRPLGKPKPSRKRRGRSQKSEVLEVEWADGYDSLAQENSSLRTDTGDVDSPAAKRRLRSEETSQASRVGAEYQAEIPAREYTTWGDETLDDDTGDVLWDPSLAQEANASAKDIEQFMQGGTEMNATFLLMEALHRSGYDSKTAKKEFMRLYHQRQDVSLALSVEEKIQAHELFRKQAARNGQKDFGAISKALWRRMDAVLVSYYMWKSHGGGYKTAKRGRESDLCEVCQDGGFLIVCDCCRAAYHLACTKLDECPKGDWMCERCTCTPVNTKRLSSAFHSPSSRSLGSDKKTAAFTLGSPTSLQGSAKRLQYSTAEERRKEIASIHKELQMPGKEGSEPRDFGPAARAQETEDGGQGWIFSQSSGNGLSPNESELDEDQPSNSDATSTKSSSSDESKADTQPVPKAVIDIDVSSSSEDGGSSFHEPDTEPSDVDSVGDTTEIAANGLFTRPIVGMHRVEGATQRSTPSRVVEYDVTFPVTSSGLLLNLGQNGVGSTFFVNYLRFPNGAKGPAEMLGLVRNMGDVVVAVDSRSTAGITFKNVTVMIKDSATKNASVSIRFVENSFVGKDNTSNATAPAGACRDGDSEAASQGRPAGIAAASAGRVNIKPNKVALPLYSSGSTHSSPKVATAAFIGTYGKGKPTAPVDTIGTHGKSKPTASIGTNGQGNPTTSASTNGQGNPTASIGTHGRGNPTASTDTDGLGNPTASMGTYGLGSAATTTGYGVGFNGGFIIPNSNFAASTGASHSQNATAMNSNALQNRTYSSLGIPEAPSQLLAASHGQLDYFRNVAGIVGQAPLFNQVYPGWDWPSASTGRQQQEGPTIPARGAPQDVRPPLPPPPPENRRN